MSQQDGLLKSLVDEDLAVELWYDAFALGGLMCVINGDFDRGRVQRVRELAVSVLLLAVLRQLFHSSPVHSIFDLARCWLFGDGATDPFCIARSDSA